MKQRYNELTNDLCVQAVLSCFDKKWHRPEVMAFINHYAGISTREFYEAELKQEVWPQLEAAEAIAYYLEEVVDELMHGEPLDMREVIVRTRPDGVTGKMRDICDLCILHQLLGHLVKLVLDPLLHARLLPTQCASIPGRGQTGLLKKAKRYIQKASLGITVCQKTDVAHAYGTLMYSVIIGLLEKDIPSACWILVVLRALAGYAPDGHLIIGGYLDAWLFNYAMSFALRYVKTCGKIRRSKVIPNVKADTSYMDDFALMGTGKTPVLRTVKLLDEWMHKVLGIRLKIKEHMIRFMSYKEERERKKHKNKGCPCLDMGGYKIHRGYVTIRPAIFQRIRRQLLRGWQEIQQFGSIHLQRAQKIMSYNGYFKRTASTGVIKKYHVKEIRKVAKSVIGYWSKRFAKAKRERMVHYVMFCTGGHQAREGRSYLAARRFRAGSPA